MEVVIGTVAFIFGLEFGGMVESNKCEDKINQVKMTLQIPKCEPVVKTVYPADISYIVDLNKSQVIILDKEMTEKVLKLPVGKK